MAKKSTALVETPSVPLAVTQTTPMQLLAIAVAKDADIDKLAKLMDLQERWEAREAEKEFVIALSAFKQSPTKLKKTKKAHVTPRGGGTGFDYWYSPLGEVSAAISADLAKHGLSFRWSVEQSEQSIAVTCILQHEAGHRERTTLKGLPDDSGAKNPIQMIGSTVTYLQRYTLLAAVGLAPQEDVDGRVIEAGTGNESRGTKAAAQAGTAKVFEGTIMETGKGSARAFGGDYKWVLLNNVAEKLFSFKAAHWTMLADNRRVRLTALEMQAQTKAFWNIMEVVQVDTLAEPVETILTRMFPTPKQQKVKRLVQEMLKGTPFNLHARVLTSLEKRIEREQPSTETGLLALLDISKREVEETAALEVSELELFGDTPS